MKNPIPIPQTLNPCLEKKPDGSPFSHSPSTRAAPRHTAHSEQTARRDAEAALLQAVRGGSAGRACRILHLCHPTLLCHPTQSNAFVISFLVSKGILSRDEQYIMLCGPYGGRRARRGRGRALGVRGRHAAAHHRRSRHRKCVVRRGRARPGHDP